MAEYLEKEVVSRLKKIPCKQKNCKSQNLDNIDIIVFNCIGIQTQKKGLMCPQCFIDDQLIKKITPVESHVISIRKFMSILTKEYLEYARQKQELIWGPNIIQSQKEQIQAQIDKYEQNLFKGILDIVQFADQIQTETLQKIKQLHKDTDFQKLFELLDEKDEQERDKMSVGKELKNITAKLMMSNGIFKLSNQAQIKEKHQAIMFSYRAKMQKAKKTLTQLIQVQKRCLQHLVS